MNRTITLKTALIVVGGLVVLAGTFFAGMQYEDYRIAKGIEDAFSGPDEPGSESGEDSQEGADSAPEPVELVKGKPLTVEMFDVDGAAGELTITLQKTALGKSSESYEDQPGLTRNIEFTLKVENTGDSPLEPTLQGHFESNDGQVYDFTGVFCDNELPTAAIDPGQFVEGCGTSDIPDDAGRLIFDSVETPFYIQIDAA